MAEKEGKKRCGHPSIIESGKSVPDVFYILPLVNPDKQYNSDTKEEYVLQGIQQKLLVKHLLSIN
jgi:hypothetical protein